MAATDNVKVLSNDGIKMKDATLEISPSATTISKTTDFHVSYLVNGKQVNATITIIVVNPDFKITIERATVTNNAIVSLTAESLDKKYTKNEWTVLPSVTILNPADDPLKDIRWTFSQIRESGGLSVTHIVTTISETGECWASTTFGLLFENLEKALQKKNFDNHIQF